MKTAISIPDDVFEDAEKLAEKLNTSRSGLYTRALTDFVSRHQDDRMTEAMNGVMEQVKDEEYRFTRKTSAQNLKNVEW